MRYRYKYDGLYYFEVQSRPWWFPFWISEKRCTSEESAKHYIETQLAGWVYYKGVK